MRCPDRECCGCDLCCPPELEDIEFDDEPEADPETPDEPYRLGWGEYAAGVVLVCLFIAGGAL